MRGRKFRPRAVRAAICTLGTPLLQSLETPLHTRTHTHARTHTHTHTHTAYPPPSIQCRDNQYSCLDSQQCISLEQVCDGTENCRDGTDELTSLCSQTAMLGSCGSNNASCEHFCHDLPGGHVICTCRYGYQLGSDRRSCHGELRVLLAFVFVYNIVC